MARLPILHLGFGLGLALGFAAVLRAAEPVPPEFRGLGDELAASLQAFERKLDVRGERHRRPVLWSAELLGANAHRGPQLLKRGQYEGVLLHADRLKAMGLRAVTLSISFPMLYRPFHRDDAEYQAYLDFYRRLVKDVRSRGLRVIVESHALFSKGGFADAGLDVAGFYRRLSFPEYQRGRLAVVRTVARELHPDYLSIVSEPDTEADQTGQPVGTPGASARLVAFVLRGLRGEGVRGVRFGAGTGTWHPQYRAFAGAFSRLPGLDYLDIHVYPVNLDLLDRALTIAEVARATGKDAAMSEAWLYKARTRELGRGVTAPEIFARDTFSFWEELDGRFLALLARLARAQGLVFFSPFWSKYFHAYLDYEQARNLPPGEAAVVSSREAAKAILEDRLTGTGRAYSRAVSAEPGAKP